MNRIIKIFIYAALFSGLIPVFQFAYGQAEWKGISGKLSEYGRLNLQEKIFVHTDKPMYFAGEIMWFKVYCVDGTFHKPVDISKVVYIELLDKDNKAVLQGKIALENGSGSGSLIIPTSVNTGSYHLRAYTNWMRNFDAEFYFEKNIRVINTLKSVERAQKDKEETLDIQFFPEGGNLVENLESRVAFRVVDKNGKGKDFSGEVVDENGKVISEFKPLKFGIGSFLFKPLSGHSYYASIKSEGSEIINSQIPAAINQGIVMKLTGNDDDSLTIHIEQSQLNPGQNSSAVYLMVYTRQILKLGQEIQLLNGKGDYTFSKSLLGEGISQLTLFNSMGQAACERLYFIRPDQKLKIEVVTDSEHYFTRQKVNLALNATCAGSAIDNIDMSVAVYKLDSMQSVDPVNILNYLWLSSDLKGNIESPDYYFSNHGKEVDEAMDNLMLTHGWRRFKWSEILSEKPAEQAFLPEYEGFILSGLLSKPLSKLPVSGLQVYLNANGKLYSGTSSDKGLVSFYTKGFQDPSHIVFLASCKYDSSFNFDFDNPYSAEFSSRTYPPLHLSKNLKNDITRYSIGMQAQNIYYPKELNQFLEPPSDSLLFYGKPDITYFLDDYTRFGTMEEVITEYVRDAFLQKRKGKFQVKLLNVEQNAIFDEEPLILFDGLPVCDIGKIIDFDPLRLRKIELIKRKYNLGSEEFDGVISFSTYHGNEVVSGINPNALLLKFEGLQKQRQFFSPVYEAGQTEMAHMPDYRNLLFWSADVKTRHDGRNGISFFTSDLEGDYVIMVQGITTTGVAACTTKTFSVSGKTDGSK
ncbi:MAG: hypothetical protein HXX13_00290 [Bacteroidetes bacterium]|nr:hypothetical protein [Bacteroidota bacterium]